MDTSTDLAKALNEQIRLIATRLADDGRDDDRSQYGFLCQCGCGVTAANTLAAYDQAEGAWLDGHKPEPAERD